MSLVAAVHLGDAIGIIGDTRATYRYNDGAVLRKDDALKVYWFPFFSVAIAGCAQSAVQLLSQFFIDCFTTRKIDVYSDVVNLDWMVSNLLRIYNKPLTKNLLGENHSRFKCLFISEDLVKLQLPHGVKPPIVVWQKSGITDGSIGTSAKVWANLDESPHRLVFGIDFPSCEVEVAKPGELLLAGTGAKAEDLLKSNATIINVMSRMTFGDRLAAVGVDLGRAAKLSTEISFNGIYLGLGLSHGFIESTFHGFHKWPEDSVPKDQYLWSPIGDELLPKYLYSAGLDVEQRNLGWIYDPFEGKKLRVKSFFDPEFVTPIGQQNYSLDL